VFTKFALNGLQHSWAAIPGGYSIELAIPWSSLGISPTSSTVIGFDIGYDDDDNGGVREHQAVWNGTVNNFQNTSAFGSLRLNSTVSSGRMTQPLMINSEETFENVSVAPNPVKGGLIKISIPENDGYAPMQIININGQIIKERILTEQEETIDIGHTSSGLHLMKVMLKGRMVVKKLWVE
jgi:hypothetical protein